MRCCDIPFPRVDLMCNTEWNGKWNFSATLAIQVLKSSALCCSCKSTLMMYISESTKSSWLSWHFICPVPAYLADLARPAAGSRGTLKAMDSHEAALDVIKVLSREQHSVLLFKAWIASVAEIFYFPFHSVLQVSATLRNGISRRCKRFKFWKVAHCVALEKVI